MKVENGKIVEAASNEMFKVYLERGWDDIMSFYDFVARCEQNGTTVVNSPFASK